MSSKKSNTQGTPKSSTKTDDRYDNMLKKIDLRIDQSASKVTNNENGQESEQNVNNHEDKSNNQSVSLLDLLSNLQSNDKAAGNQTLLKSQLSDLTQKKAFKEALSTRKQEELDRKANYQIVKKDIKKWQEVIQRNRDAPHLDLTQKASDKFRINSNILETTKKSALEVKVEAKLKELNLLKEEDFLNDEKEMLKKLNPDEAKRRQEEISKHRNLMFYQELKTKRVAKIKSKLYHKIKNKKEERIRKKLAEGIDQSDPTAQLREIEDLEKKRAEERMSLRHKTKSKFTKQLLRFGNKKDTEQSVNDIAQLKRELLKKVNPDQKDRLLRLLQDEPLNEGDDDEDLNDQDFKDKIIKELEGYIEQEDQGEDDKTKDPKKKKLTGFMKKLAEQREINSKRQASDLVQKLRNTKKLDDFEMSDEDKEAADENDNGTEKKKEKKIDNINHLGRKKFHKEEKDTGAIGVDSTKKNKRGPQTNEILKSFVENPDKQTEIAVEPNAVLSSGKKGRQNNTSMEIEETSHLSRLDPKDLSTTIQEDTKTKNKNKNSKTKQTNTQMEEEVDWSANKEGGKKSKNSTGKDDLISGLNFEGLNQKYTKSSNPKFLNAEIDKFNEENKEEMYNELSNFQISGSNIYEEEFAQEKDKLLEAEIPAEKKALKGWGSWTGIGIKEKKVDPAIELKRKIQKIEELKRIRRDGGMKNVIIHEERNKQLAKYLVQDLPHPYKSAQQFDYVQGVALGPEWNTLKNHEKLIKPKIITKVGEVINPIKAPRRSKK